MTKHTVKDGETFEDVSRFHFGSVDKSADILASNPGVSNPPSKGTILNIPKHETPEFQLNEKRGVVSLIVDGEKFKGWTEINIRRSMDSFGVFSYKSLWLPENKEFREFFRPFSYKPVSIYDGAALIFNGTLMNVQPEVTPTSSTVVASGYSVPGVLNDCTPPVSSFPLERDNQDLQQIAIELLKPFGIPVEFENVPGSEFDREAIDPAQKILGYLTRLAQQRNLIITDTPNGACKFHQETAKGSPVAILDENDSSIITISPQFNSQNYYSHVSGQAVTVFGKPDSDAGGAYTVINPKLEGVLRPFTFKPNDAHAGDNKAIVESKAGRMFAGAVLYTITIPSWYTPDGKLWEPNTTLKIKAPHAMIYSLFEFLIKDVAYSRDKSRETVELSLVLPGSFKGVIPESMPWDF